VSSQCRFVLHWNFGAEWQKAGVTYEQASAKIDYQRMRSSMLRLVDVTTFGLNIEDRIIWYSFFA
jgi:hypothetical protein